MSERSPTVIRHETARAERLIDQWEAAIDHPLMRRPLNMVQITPGCALGLEVRYRDFRWRGGHPNRSAGSSPSTHVPASRRHGRPPDADRSPSDFGMAREASGVWRTD
jgi:hypothetical protein